MGIRFNSKEKMTKLKEILLLVGMLCTLFTQAQDHPKLALHNIHWNQQAIQEAGIRSVFILADLNEHGINQSEHTLSGKTRELEFDTLGMPVYSVRVTHPEYYPFITYGKGTELELMSFNSDGQPIEYYAESEYSAYGTTSAYNKKGRLSEVQSFSGDVLIMQEAFHWKGKRMVNYSLVDADSLNKKNKKEYDDQGRLLLFQSDKYIIRNSYTDSGEHTTVYTENYNDDSLLGSSEKTWMQSGNQIVRYIEKDHLGDTVVRMHAEYDDRGNITNFFWHDLTDTYHGDQTYPPMTLRIENSYTTTGLLSKRRFYFSREDVGENILTRIERFVYDEDPLPYKIEKGSLYKF